MTDAQVIMLFELHRRGLDINELRTLFLANVEMWLTQPKRGYHVPRHFTPDFILASAAELYERARPLTGPADGID